ncbi:UDP-galactose/UDP-N-acetylglucosamine transporter srf-3 [Cimex lectularius]|uniref:UDP-N-acetylglucosamine transporter n=1 Tax=Cimex lectularius TaxID=79782 RepID=A0A8I6RIX6_CIMLE|nr:UDP-galactose/UDP-N-acetylglucosamine transporter srf-3 [Cimex lectularius]XP_014247049.1 UDP-galactose/UDP-N-acetylglucosamine transporter srf-3 [Cimex lectularius]XP_014247050.1 UDP-galactose/UDP-N-acetylglucosamine transporter srf-3 [Cimex lectularius]XP_014247051.1 UDP-galactose/UDP-N-acetylglucosamine transporter srf-3 [Cimex lectularius]XP_014247052.1 UDP-galactose/UDP-N-acetylglucosamine transporter srf-3 [Cimex lectularius]
MTVDNKSQVLKVTSLVTLTLQNAVLGLSMRYARTRVGPMFISSTAVVMSELVKLLTCLFLVYKENHFCSKKWSSSLYSTVIQQPLDTLKVCVPSFVYIIQNNLLYVSASHLDAATYQVTYQLKILTTALFAVALLKKKLSQRQWFALVVLVVGVALVQLSGSEGKSPREGQNKVIGFSAALGACVLSGFAGIYFEMILKGSNEISVWMRNVQLSLLSLPFGFITCITTDWSEINSKGWLYGYDFFIFYLVFLQAGGGLVVALVVKYADNILKGFATSLAIVISCVCSMYFFQFKLTFMFVLGATCVITSIFLYSLVPTDKKQYSLLVGKEKSENI